MTALEKATSEYLAALEEWSKEIGKLITVIIESRK